MTVERALALTDGREPIVTPTMRLWWLAFKMTIRDIAREEREGIFISLDDGTHRAASEACSVAPLSIIESIDLIALIERDQTYRLVEYGNREAEERHDGE